MGEAKFDVGLTERAWSDRDAIETYWARRGEEWRGAKYFADLRKVAESQLADPQAARRGRTLRDCDMEGAQEILAFGVYRIIYEIDEAAARVDILRSWHAYRAAPPPE